MSNDVILRGYGGVSNVVDTGPYPLIADPKIYTDCMHLSNVMGAYIKLGEIWGGSEDCIDCNNYTRNVIVWRTTLKSQGEYCMTIKGGASNITLDDVIISNHGTACDIDLGNWSDQSTVRVKGVLLKSVRATDLKPVLVRVLWAEPPVVIGGDVKVVGITSWSGTGWVNRAIVWGWRLGRKYRLWGTKS